MRKLYCLLASAAMLLLSACGGAAESAVYTNTGNPLRSVTAEVLENELGVTFSLPQDAEEVQYTIISGDEPIAEMRFTRAGTECCCRVQSSDIPDDELPDISGMYYEWTRKASALVGYNAAVLTWNEGAEGVIRWYDYAPGLLYSVSLSTGATQAALEELAAEVYLPAQGESDGAADAVDAPAELTNLLAAISQKYQSGVMGSSLRAARYAATLMDWFTAHPVSEAEVNAAVLDFLSTLDTEELAAFPEKLEMVHHAADELFGEYGEGLLYDCGYERQFDHWDQKQMDNYFDLIWDIVGKGN